MKSFLLGGDRKLQSKFDYQVQSKLTIVVHRVSFLQGSLILENFP